MITLNFTMASIQNLDFPHSGRDTYKDIKASGLYLTVTARGVKTFSYVRRIGKRVSRITLGRFPGVTAEVARKEALLLSSEIAQGQPCR